MGLDLTVSYIRSKGHLQVKWWMPCSFLFQIIILHEKLGRVGLFCSEKET